MPNKSLDIDDDNDDDDDMEETIWILMSVIEGEDESRLCGRTSIELAARAWAMGEGHRVFVLPPDGKLLESGYETVEFSAE